VCRQESAFAPTCTVLATHGFPLAMTVLVQFFSHRHQASVRARNFDSRRRAMTSGWSLAFPYRIMEGFPSVANTALMILPVTAVISSRSSTCHYLELFLQRKDSRSISTSGYRFSSAFPSAIRAEYAEIRRKGRWVT
jgi:hypothetical protein